MPGMLDGAAQAPSGRCVASSPAVQRGACRRALSRPATSRRSQHAVEPHGPGMHAAARGAAASRMRCGISSRQYRSRCSSQTPGGSQGQYAVLGRHACCVFGRSVRTILAFRAAAAHLADARSRADATRRPRPIFSVGTVSACCGFSRCVRTTLASRARARFRLLGPFMTRV